MKIDIHSSKSTEDSPDKAKKIAKKKKKFIVFPKVNTDISELKIDKTILEQIEAVTKEFKSIAESKEVASEEKLNQLRITIAIVRRRFFLAKQIFDRAKNSTHYHAARRLMYCLDYLAQSFSPSLKFKTKGDELKTSEIINVPLNLKYYHPQNVIEYCSSTLPSPQLVNHKEFIDSGITIFLANFNFFMLAFNPNFPVFQQWAKALQENDKEKLGQITFNIIDALKKDTHLKSDQEVLGLIQSIYHQLHLATIQENNKEKVTAILQKYPEFAESLSGMSLNLYSLNKLWSNYSTDYNTMVITTLRTYKDFYTNLFSLMSDQATNFPRIWKKKDLLENAILRLTADPVDFSVFRIGTESLSYSDELLVDDLTCILTNPAISKVRNDWEIAQNKKLEEQKLIQEMVSDKGTSLKIRDVITVGIFLAIFATLTVFSFGFSLLSLAFLIPASTSLFGIGALVVETERFSSKEKAFMDGQKSNRPDSSYKRLNKNFPLKHPDAKKDIEEKPEKLDSPKNDNDISKTNDLNPSSKLSEEVVVDTSLLPKKPK